MASMMSSSAPTPLSLMPSMIGMNCMPARPKTFMAAAERSVMSGSFAISAITLWKPSMPTCPVAFVIFWNADASSSGDDPFTPRTPSAVESLVISSVVVPADCATSDSSPSFFAVTANAASAVSTTGRGSATANAATNLAAMGYTVDISTPSLTVGESFQIKISNENYLVVEMDLGGQIMELNIAVQA